MLDLQSNAASQTHIFCQFADKQAKRGYNWSANTTTAAQSFKYSQDIAM